jgi:hypothetical protein
MKAPAPDSHKRGGACPRAAQYECMYLLEIPCDVLLREKAANVLKCEQLLDVDPKPTSSRAREQARSRTACPRDESSPRVRTIRSRICVERHLP